MPVATSTERDPGGAPIAGARIVVRLLTSEANPSAPRLRARRRPTG